MACLSEGIAACRMRAEYDSAISRGVMGLVFIEYALDSFQQIAEVNRFSQLKFIFFFVTIKRKVNDFPVKRL